MSSRSQEAENRVGGPGRAAADGKLDLKGKEGVAAGGAELQKLQLKFARVGGGGWALNVCQRQPGTG